MKGLICLPYTGNFIVPDYYPDFTCKCGECRHTCCGGWRIPLGMDEYFRLLGAECPDELRKRLDVSLSVVDAHSALGRDAEHYAYLSHDFLGRCRLQREDGLCALQRECGEGALPEVCRRYPRAPRLSPFPECSTSGSGEKTLELLFSDERPLTFIKKELTFAKNPHENDREPIFSPEKHIALRTEAFALLRERSKPFDERLRALGARLCGKESTCPSSSDGGTLSAGASLETLSSGSPRETLLGIFEMLARTSSFLQGLSEKVVRLLSEGQNSFSELLEGLREGFPALDVYLEKLYLNHLFYKSFPDAFVSVGDHLTAEFASLAASFSLLVVILAAEFSETSSGSPELERLIDLTASFFRVVEHSRFDECVSEYLFARGYRGSEKIAEIFSFTKG